MKFIITILFILPIVAFSQENISEFCGGKKSKVQTEGLVDLYSTMSPESMHKYIWFRDSTVIFEIMETHSESSNGITTSEVIRLRSYTLLHLPTMQAQDYLTFSDTSTPITRYRLKDDEIISWGFYRTKKHIHDKYLDSLLPAPDTTIDGKTVKRFSFIVQGDDWSMKTTYGLTRSNEENIFHMSRSMDDRFPGCKLTFVRYDQPAIGMMTYNKLLFIRNKLTLKEHTVFDKWELNLKTSSLPITSFQEAARSLVKTRFGF